VHGVILSFLLELNHWDLNNPLKGNGYQSWSGILSDVGEITLITGGAFAAYRFKKNHECHVESPKNCRRFGRPVPGTGHVACRKHHPHAAERGSGITAEDILQHHEESGA
jgi:hypothetical protein